jgi:hypothetical protein
MKPPERDAMIAISRAHPEGIEPPTYRFEAEMAAARIRT